MLPRVLCMLQYCVQCFFCPCMVWYASSECFMVDEQNATKSVVSSTQNVDHSVTVVCADGATLIIQPGVVYHLPLTMSEPYIDLQGALWLDTCTCVCVVRYMYTHASMAPGTSQLSNIEFSM